MSYIAVKDAFTASPITMTDGQPTMVSGTFQEVPQTTKTVTWNRSAFTAAASNAGPGATMQGYDIFVYSEPAGTTQ